MLPFQPPLWRMDIVVFSDGHVPLLDELGCRVGVRASPTDPNRCWIVPTYVKVHSDTFNYRFADSINVVAVDHIATEPYDWLLRCDIDTFFTPVFATWRPTKLTVGSVGGYCFDGYDTCDRLHSIGLKLNLTTSLVRDIGSTWYGPAKMIRECGKLSMDIINHLHENEFSADDKDGGVAGWPRWHYGVLTMYSGHLAIPHCTRETGFEKRNDMIDHTSYSKDKVARHAHVHAWQSQPLNFSKVRFLNGEYDNVDVQSLDLGNVQDYLMYMAKVSNGKANAERTITYELLVNETGAVTP
ncbi:Aste57867_25057 [Aphanomyces stellatus]|uniref:Aste57867_25057 protein n=1 Tax=Aphanomyces stellatus TaxID=120398 RepID=A0A485LWJ7_9STRA|nr:hypothetical protein As57867_024979 [Aphanomyces stellatus]VFU01688.1 Aste57867_25057 [Aphanomyces stellatus]